MAKKLLLKDDTTGREYLTSAAVKSDSVAINNDVASIDITFSSAMPDTNYTITCIMLNIIDVNPQFQPITITAFDENGFTATWNANTLTANYKLNYIAIGIL